MRVQAIGTPIMHNVLLNPENFLIYIFTYLFFIKISGGLLDIVIKNIIFNLILIYVYQLSLNVKYVIAKFENSNIIQNLNSFCQWF